MQAFRNRDSRKKGRGNLLYRSLHAHLRKRLLRGEFLAEGKLPTEPELADAYGVSLITIRQAQKLLVEEGLLKKQQGRGTFIAPAAKRMMRILWVCGVGGEAESVHPFFMNVLNFSGAECAKLGYGMEHAWIANREREIPPPYDSEDALRDFIGFVFVNCNIYHPLLPVVQRLQLKHVLMGGMFPGPCHASLDLRGAIRLGLEDSGRDNASRTVVTVAEKMPFIRETAGELGLKIRLISISSAETHVQHEAQAYLRVRKALARNGTRGCFLFMDDFIARGGTRAMLELGYGRRKDVSVSVICGRHDILPLGLPVRWIVHDTQKLVHEGFRLLNDKLTNRPGTDEGFVNEYKLLGTSLLRNR